jgi:2-polyprenyl-6-methoxyphenol hydroxylase-like FAD-dependent oxidoreductase
VGADLVSIWPDVTVALRIGVIPPMPAWPASQVTVIGDAVHLAPGFGGDLAMRDAHHLRAALVDAYRGRLDLLDAIGAYENTMRRNSFTSVAVKAGA